MTEERIEKLKAIGFDFRIQVQHLGSFKDRWNANIAALLEFKAKYGHTYVPARSTKYVPEVDRKLSKFCQHLRTNYRKFQSNDQEVGSTLTEERIKQLEDIGFDFSTQSIPKELRSELFGHK